MAGGLAGGWLPGGYHGYDNVTPESMPAATTLTTRSIQRNITLAVRVDVSCKAYL